MRVVRTLGYFALAVGCVGALLALPESSRAGQPGMVGSQALPAPVVLVSIASDGTAGNDYSDSPALSVDGRFVAFESRASNLVAGDTNSFEDVFVHDRQTGETTRVSRATDGTQATGESAQPSLSADGRFVAFWSSASNLVADDTNNRGDVFVHDRQTGETTRVSLASSGAQGEGDIDIFSALSADGRFVAFGSADSNLVPGDTNNESDVFVHDRQTGQTTRVSGGLGGNQADGTAFRPALSADGRFVAFLSGANNLGACGTNNESDVFVHDRQTGQTSCVSLAADGSEGNKTAGELALSADGRFVTFQSLATNLVAGDTNNVWDIFVHDRQSGQITRVSRATDGTQGIAFSRKPAISADGRYVTFESQSNTLVAGDTNGDWDIFVHDRQTAQTTRVSLAVDGKQGNRASTFPAISADGGIVAFISLATDLVPNDNSGTQHIYVTNRERGAAPAPMPVARIYLPLIRR